MNEIERTTPPHRSLKEKIIADIKKHPGKAALIGASVLTAAAALGIIIHQLRKHKPDIDPTILNDSEARTQKNGVRSTDIVLNTAVDLDHATNGAVRQAAQALAQTIEVPAAAETFEDIATALQREQPKPSA